MRRSDVNVSRAVAVLSLSLLGSASLESIALGSTAPVLFGAKFGHDYGGCLGASIAGGIDLDGDEVPDFLVAEPNTCPGGTFNSGSVLAYSGRTGTQLYEVTSNGDDDFGASVAAIDDLDGDGVSDFAVGSPQSGAYSGSLLVYSGKTGSLLYRLDGGGGNVPTGSFGFSIAGLHDVDGDGMGDFLVGAPESQDGLGNVTGAVALVSGASGLLLRTIEGSKSRLRFGWAVAAAGDLSGDGIEDFLVGATSFSSSDTSAVYAISGSSGAIL